MRLARTAALLTLVSFALLSCSDKRALPKPSPDTPVFIISVDTMRSDHLPAYGYTGIQTPNFDAFRRDAILYEHAYSHTPLTLPSHTSILTGLLPADHGVRDNLGFQLSPSVKTIAETLRERGYTTGAAVSAYVLRKDAGLTRGFDFYDDASQALSGEARLIANIQRPGAETIQIAKDWLSKQTKTPFLLLHLYEPHTPYKPPEPYKSLYKLPYDGEIAYADQLVGDFLQSLKNSGLYDKSLIILLSDHGEGLNDHGEKEHGLFLYREDIQVPLMVKLPEEKFAGESVAATVQLIDVVPTIMERTTAAAPSPKLPGVSLTSFLTGDKAGRSVYSETYYPRFHFGWADQHSLIDAHFHYIQSPKPQLFNVEKDFAEKNNVLESERRHLFAMKAAITPLVREAAAPAPVAPEDVARLAALGYLGSTVSTKPNEALPDPKDHILTFEYIGQAFNLFHSEKYDQALAMVDGLLKENALILDLYDLRSKILMRMGRANDAIEAAKDGLRLSPNASHLAVDIADMLLDAGRLDEAQKHAELALRLDPGSAHEVLARIWIEKKDLAKAEKEANLALATAHDRISTMLTLARVQREQGKLELALKTLNDADRGRKPGQQVVGLHFLRGDVYARMGMADEAERDFRAEMQKFPEEPLAYKNLVLLLVAQGRVPEATQVIRNLIERAPTLPSYLAVCHVLQTLGDSQGVRYWARQGTAKFPYDPTLRKLST
jgi:arylsulfatase A-like enzyme/Flp pilus assembly protein TadD